MMARRILLLTVVLAGLAAVASAQAQTAPSIQPGDNGMDSSFARIEMDPRPAYGGQDTPIEARILIKNTSGMGDAHILMFGFNGLSDSVEIRLREVTAQETPLAIEQDDRDQSLRQPKVWIKPENASFGHTIVMRGAVTAHGNGQFHVGAIVIAFDRDYQKMVTPQNEYAEVYAFGLLRAIDAAEGPGRPPFEGQGNVPSLGPLALVLVLGGVSLLRRA